MCTGPCIACDVVTILYAFFTIINSFLFMICTNILHAIMLLKLIHKFYSKIKKIKMISS